MCAQRSEFSSDEELESAQWSNNLAEVRGTINRNGIECIDDDTLYRSLRELKVNVGPIVDSTRKLYRNLLLRRLGTMHNNVTHRNGSVDDEFTVSTEEDESEEEVEVKEEDFDDGDENEAEEELREPIVRPKLLHQSLNRQPLLMPNMKSSINARSLQTTRIHKIHNESHFLRNAFIAGLAVVLISLIVMYNLEETWR